MNSVSRGSRTAATACIGRSRAYRRGPLDSFRDGCWSHVIYVRTDRAMQSKRENRACMHYVQMFTQTCSTTTCLCCQQRSHWPVAVSSACISWPIVLTQLSGARGGSWNRVAEVFIPSEPHVEVPQSQPCVTHTLRRRGARAAMTFFACALLNSEFGHCCP